MRPRKKRKIRPSSLSQSNCFLTNCNKPHNPLSLSPDRFPLFLAGPTAYVSHERRRALFSSLPRGMQREKPRQVEKRWNFLAHPKIPAEEGITMAPMIRNFCFVNSDPGAINSPPPHRYLTSLPLELDISNGWSPLRVDQLGCPRRRGGGGCYRVELRLRVA